MVRKLLRAAYGIAKPVLRRAGLSRGTVYEAAEIILGPDVRGVVDGGAYEGQHALYFAGVFPKATIYAFEPTPATFEALRKTAGRERRIVPVCAALSDRDGVAYINDNVLSSTNSILESATSAEASDLFAGRGRTLARVEIRTQTLDRFAAEHIRQCDFLKLDVQGYEIQALRGASRLLREQIRAVVAEVRFKPLYVNDVLFGELDEFLAGHGFRLRIIGEVTHQPADGTAFEANALWAKDQA